MTATPVTQAGIASAAILLLTSGTSTDPGAYPLLATMRVTSSRQGSASGGASSVPQVLPVRCARPI